jgi:lipoprotein-releasing system ATP-binding protein
MTKSILQLSSISKTFTQDKQVITVLNDISATFRQGNTYAIMGVSGSGKSTLLHLIAGLDTPTTGIVYYNGLNINSVSFKKNSFFLNRSIGLVFQSSHMIKELTVIENIMLPGLIRQYHTSELRKKACMFLEKVGLLHKINSFPGELSGGQQQRVALARALINEPSFLIADEPTGNLDANTGKTMIELLIDCHKEWGMGIIITSHDAFVIEKMNIVFNLYNGTLTLQHKDSTLCIPQKKFLEKQYK